MINELTKIRRDLHKIHEPGLKEYKTSKYIREKLDSWGVTYETWLETAVVAIFGKKGEKETVAFRADIDGLPVTETPKEYASEHPGWHTTYPLPYLRHNDESAAVHTKTEVFPP